LRNLELIGEAAIHIPEKIRAAHSEIPWRMIIATRNRLIHGYLGIDDDTIWSIVQEDVPELLPLLHALKNDPSPCIPRHPGPPQGDPGHPGPRIKPPEPFYPSTLYPYQTTRLGRWYA